LKTNDLFLLGASEEERQNLFNQIKIAQILLELQLMNLMLYLDKF
jgi:hypothetical protein